MTPEPAHIETWLKALGKARADGVLERRGGNQPFPWRGGMPHPLARTDRAGWRRGARGLAAAAAIGLVLVGAWQLEALWPSRTEVPLSAGMALASREADGQATVAQQGTQALLDGDFNSDGVVDAEDIQDYLTRTAQKRQGEVESRDARDFTRLLLGS